ncbi:MULTISPECIES: TetR/AcrR family transcriptional regulator [unclassified Brevibacterium]|uniref:TetR/AcrR family transcriptional regulator n=1 Tax=unclassified Brevibacterium TaxID=2614124 RepID=UPI0010F6B7ED|nr:MULTISPECIES: TetR/AcrR family transcriptional regulator [unclassified Brevibacterium]MCM1013066.1 TetR/AcrR family transcriptional regulator [Brevibacterium sp. XM4083]
MSETTQMAPDGTREPTLRADAAANRARIVAAARSLFAERGLDVPMNAIARRAGVGIATLFRRFPDRSALIAEVFATQIDRCEIVLAEAAEDPDPWHGFTRFISVVCRMQIEDRGFTEALLTSLASTADVDAKRRDAEAAFTLLVDRAKTAGMLRPDFAVSDLTMLILANGGLTSAPHAHAHDLSRRLVAYLLSAFGTERARAAGSPEDSPTADLRGGRPLPPPSRLGIDALYSSPEA